MKASVETLAEIAKDIFSQWDKAWPDRRAGLESRGVKLACQPGCVGCCYMKKPCTFAEACAVSTIMRANLSAQEQEIARVKVENVVSAPHVSQQCPFLVKGVCAIYEARPLACRALWVSENQRQNCREISSAVNQPECSRTLSDLTKKLEERQAPYLDGAKTSFSTLSEGLHEVWKQSPLENFSIANSAWQKRLKSRSSAHDQNWIDDLNDWNILNFPLSLPVAGDYLPDFTLLRKKVNQIELYDETIESDNMPEFISLYKRKPHAGYNWDTEEFYWERKPETSELPYIIWMSDSPQERFMMWEAAKCCSGKVLCGGLGLGVFPQLALSQKQVESIDIVEYDPNIIKIIKSTWERNPWPHSKNVRIINDSIENYLKTTKEKYDSVYIDTWDAIYHEYLPHLNFLRKLSEGVLKPNGKIYLWAYDLMLRMFLSTARSVFLRRKQFLLLPENGLKTFTKKFGLLYDLIFWLRQNPNADLEDFLGKAYDIATEKTEDLGILKLQNFEGAESLARA